MTMRKHGDLMATVGTWTDDKGRTHKRRIRCGVVMRDDVSGRMSIRLELVPVSPDWKGWLSIVRSGEAGVAE